MSDDIISDEEKAALAVGPDDEDQQVNDQQTDDQQKADEEQRQADERARDEKGRFVAKEGEEETQQDDKPKGDGKVPQGALHAERERRKAAEARAEEAQKALNQIAEMRSKLNGGDQQQQQHQGDDDPDSVDYLKRKIAELEQGQTKTTNFLQSQQLDNAEHQQLVTVLTQSENEFRKDHPDYDAAIEHVIGARANELRIYGLSDVEINQTIREEIADISRAAIAQKRDPAEVGYEIAKLRGYIAKAPEQQQEQKPNGQGKAADVIAAIANAQKQGKSLGQASGGGSANAINAETLGQMSDDEFAQLYSTPEGAALIDSLLGA